MARKKNGWLASLPNEPCARCGFTEHDETPLAPAQQRSRPALIVRAPAQPNVFPYAGPSAEFRQANTLTPQVSDSAIEEGLLIGSDFEGGYQTISRDEDAVVEQPENVVVVKAKAKGKKKVVRPESTQPPPACGENSGGTQAQ